MSSLKLPARLLIAAALFLSLSVPVTHVHAQAADPPYPRGPVRIVVGFPAGGGIDAVARVLAPKLAASLKQPVIVENKPGANGVIAMQQVAQAAPDGQTIFFGTTGNLSVNPVFLKSLPFDFDRDFAPVTQVSSVDFVVVAGPSSPFKDVAGLIHYAKTNAGMVAFASSGKGGLPHLVAQLLSNQAALGATHVAYKGSAPALSDVMAGHVHFVIEAAGLIVPQLRAGKVQAIATTSSRRLAALPDVPTVAETIPGFEATNYYGVVVRAGTPATTIRTLQMAIANAMREPDIREKLVSLGAVPVGSTPEAFREHMKAESVRWARVIRDANIQPE